MTPVLCVSRCQDPPSPLKVDESAGPVWSGLDLHLYLYRKASKCQVLYPSCFKLERLLMLVLMCFYATCMPSNREHSRTLPLGQFRQAWTQSTAAKTSLCTVSKAAPSPPRKLLTTSPGLHTRVCIPEPAPRKPWKSIYYVKGNRI